MAKNSKPVHQATKDQKTSISNSETKRQTNCSYDKIDYLKLLLMQLRKYKFIEEFKAFAG